MFWFRIAQCLSFIFDLLSLPQLTDRQKDIQILLLRQQLWVLQHKARQPKHFSRFDNPLLAILVARLRYIATDFRGQIEPILLLIILSRQHLERVLVEYAHFYNQRRPHQGLHNHAPEGDPVASAQGPIHRREVLGGIIQTVFSLLDEFLHDTGYLCGLV